MMESISPIRVLVVADDPLARAGLVGLVTLTKNCEPVGQVAGGDRLDIDVYQPDLVLWDAGWDTSEEVIAELRTRLDDVPPPEQGGTPVLAMAAEPEAAPQLWASGVMGILPRDAAPDQVDGAALAVVAGLITLEPAFADSLLPKASLDSSVAPLEELTPRENDVLQLLAEGLANKAIARRLDISEHTVKFHVNAILSKLGATSRTQAVVRATRAGLIVL